MVRASDSEKLTINLGLVDLGQIDLLVRQGFYSGRTDFIRTAIRNQLATHADAVQQTIARNTLVLGVQHYTRTDLEAVLDLPSGVDDNQLEEALSLEFHSSACSSRA